MRVLGALRAFLSTKYLVLFSTKLNLSALRRVFSKADPAGQTFPGPARVPSAELSIPDSYGTHYGTPGVGLRGCKIVMRRAAAAHSADSSRPDVPPALLGYPALN